MRGWQRRDGCAHVFTRGLRRARALIVGADTLVLDGDSDRNFTQNFMIGARIKF